MNIRTYNAIAPKGLAVFGDTYTVGPDIPDSVGILVRSQNLLTETIPDSVIAIARAGAGVNNIPVDAMSERGIVVFNAPGANANAVKELVIGSIIAAYRNIPAGAGFVESLTSEGDALEKEVEASKKKFAGFEVMGKTLGVIGLGAIGGQVANAATKLGMTVIGFDPHATPEQRARLSSTVSVTTDLTALFAASDAITVHVPLLPETKGIIGAAALTYTKRGVIILNFSRGGIVDDAAVLAGISGGVVLRYVTDFPTAELRGKTSVIALPHLGASTEEAEEQSAVMAARQMKDYIETGTIVNAVNLPHIALEGRSAARISLIHKNVPDMLGQITHTLGTHGVNIESVANGARGAYAYTLIDVGTKPTEDVLVSLRAIPNVIRERMI